MSEMTNEEIIEKGLISLGKFCVEQQQMDMGGALAVVISAFKQGRIKELSWDLVQLGIKKDYLDKETKAQAMRKMR